VLRRTRRGIFFVHRWLGIIIALLMAVWALSGLVMMYVAFPETTDEERLGGLEPLDRWECCESLSLPGDQVIQSASIEMFAGSPVLRWQGAQSAGMLGLESGNTPPIDASTAAGVASGYMHRHTGRSLEPSIEQIRVDQWTVYGQYRRHQPLYKASFGDEAGTVLYVSGSDGTVVQDTAARERFWNWLGAVPHWLYFTSFRQNQPLWYNFVVYASLLGVFLTVTGIYIGIAQFGRGKRRIPYRGLGWWHHVTGLVFGVLTLTWVLSGLFSMQPWGMFESKGPGKELAAMAGRPANAEDLARFVKAVSELDASGVVTADLSVQQGEAWAILAHADGSRVRTSLPDLDERPLSEVELEGRARLASEAAKIADMRMIHTTDAYYYGHKGEVSLPVFRIIHDDEEQRRFYIDPQTGELVGYVDGASRGYRWWFNGLHRMDFVPWLRARPIWDLVTLPLMLGVSLLCLIGLVLGIRRLRRTV